MYKTRIGLRIRAIGENPKAAASLGINVQLIRYVCTIFGGAMLR
jgi:simple sugar transport system permease protein